LGVCRGIYSLKYLSRQEFYRVHWNGHLSGAGNRREKRERKSGIRQQERLMDFNLWVRSAARFCHELVTLVLRIGIIQKVLELRFEVA